MNSVFATCDAYLRAETVSSTFKYGEHIQYINCSALNFSARTPGSGQVGIAATTATACRHANLSGVMSVVKI